MEDGRCECTADAVPPPTAGQPVVVNDPSCLTSATIFRGLVVTFPLMFLLTERFLRKRIRDVIFLQFVTTSTDIEVRKRGGIMEFYRRASGIASRALKKQGGEPKRTLKKVLSELGFDVSEQRLGGSKKKYYRWFEKDKLPAERVGPLCRALNDFQILDLIEEQSGRTAVFDVELPARAQTTPMDDVRAVQQFVKETGEALKSLGETLADGIVDDTELDPTCKEIAEVIVECVRLRKLLTEKNKQWVRTGRPKPGRVKTAGGSV